MSDLYKSPKSVQFRYEIRPIIDSFTCTRIQFGLYNDGAVDNQRSGSYTYGEPVEPILGFYNETHRRPVKRAISLRANESDR